MICYNCGNALTNSDFCSHCGTNVSVYKKIVKLSNGYYNAGLVRAQNRDLTGAAEVLNRSLKLNKRNTDARNLLGLVYNEMGETVQAFKEWVISTNIQPNSNPASRYLLEFQKEKGKVTELNRVIKKFNVALEYARNNTDDMAIIQLKKVLNSNPNMLKAYQLLGLIYIKQGQYERARREIRKSLKIDRSNALSIKYLREIGEYLDEEKKVDPDKRMERRRSLRGNMPPDRPYLSGNDAIVPNDKAEAARGAQSILQFILGILLGAALVYFVVTPARLNHVRTENNNAQVEYNQNIAAKNSAVSELQEEIDDIKSENEKLKSQLSQYTDTGNTISSNYSNLLAAVDSYIAERYDEAAKSLEKVDGSLKMNSKSFTNVYKTMTSKLSSRVASSAYDSGMAAMDKEDYDEAIKQFKKCLEADEKNDEALYYLAWAYEHKGNTKNAQKYFQKIVDEHKDSDYYDVAKNKVADDSENTDEEAE